MIYIYMVIIIQDSPKLSNDYPNFGEAHGNSWSIFGQVCGGHLWRAPSDHQGTFFGEAGPWVPHPMDLMWLKQCH